MLLEFLARSLTLLARETLTKCFKYSIRDLYLSFLQQSKPGTIKYFSEKIFRFLKKKSSKDLFLRIFPDLCWHSSKDQFFSQIFQFISRFIQWFFLEFHQHSPGQISTAISEIPKVIPRIPGQFPVGIPERTLVKQKKNL